MGCISLDLKRDDWEGVEDHDGDLKKYRRCGEVDTDSFVPIYKQVSNEASLRQAHKEIGHVYLE